MSKYNDKQLNETLTESKAKFARRLGVSDSYISRISKLDGFPLNSDGAVIVDRALAFMRDNIDAGRPGRKAGTPNGARDEYLELKCDQLKIAIEKSTLELDTMRGELVAKSDAVKAIRTLARVYRDHMLNFASRYGQEIAAQFQAPAGEFIGTLDTKIREALAQASATPMPYDAEACTCHERRSDDK